MKHESVREKPSFRDDVPAVHDAARVAVAPVTVSGDAGRRFGYRVAFTSCFAFLFARYLFFFVAAERGWRAGNFGGILVHGLIFGLIVVVGQMYTGEIAPPSLRNQAQGLVILLTSGIGLFVSNMVMHPVVAATVRADGRHDWSVPFLVSMVIAGALTVAAAILFRPEAVTQQRR